MYHTTFQATPGHILFGIDMILDPPFIYNRESIRRRKQEIIYEKLKRKQEYQTAQY